MRIFRFGLQSFVAPAAFTSGKALTSKSLWRSVTAVMAAVMTVGLLLTGAVASAQVYTPASYYDCCGDTTTISPENAYDGDTTTYATVYGYTDSTGVYLGDCDFSGFPSVVLSATKTLTITAAFDISATGIAHHGKISVNVNGNFTDFNTTTSIGQANYTVSIPSGTDLSTIDIRVHASPGLVYGNFVNVYIYDINIQ